MAKRKRRDDWTGLLLAEGPSGVLCIRKPGQEHWQFPGGKRLAKDRDSRFTAVRENREETGVPVRVGCIRLIASRSEFNQRSHQPFQVDLYYAELTDEQIATHFAISREGEEVAVFSWEQLNGMGDTFSPYHRMLAERAGRWRET